jgi:hypothetical protein
MVELAELIRELRSELDAARLSGQDADLRFELGPIELEVVVGVEKEGGAGAKVRIYVLELGGDARATASSTQRIKLTLQPNLVTPAGGPQVPYVSGEAIPGER